MTFRFLLACKVHTLFEAGMGPDGWADARAYPHRSPFCILKLAVASYTPVGFLEQICFLHGFGQARGPGPTVLLFAFARNHH